MCFESHDGQVDKAGVPYANHPLHLAEQMHQEDEICAALLHDVMEDCGKTADDIRAIGVSERAIEALLLLTHGRGVPYLDYVRKLRDNEIARKVKIADLRHNSELSRIDVVDARSIERLRKYMEARVVLGDMAYALSTPVGEVRVEVNGEAYPFAFEDETREGSLPCVGGEKRGGGSSCGAGEDASAKQGRNPMAHRAEGCFRLEIDTLPLAVGDRVRIVHGFDGNVVDRGIGRSAIWQVYAKDGYTMCISSCAGEDEGDVVGCSFRYSDEDDSYRVVEDPIMHRFHPAAHIIGIRIAWSRDYPKADACIAGQASGL